MDMSEILSLISVTYTTDSIGQKIPTESSRDVFCRIDSVSRAEWYDAGRAGMKPQYTVTMFEPEYAGENIAEYNGKRYGIYRTYRRKNELIELYLEEKAGI